MFFMSATPWIMISIAVLVLILAVVAIFAIKRKGKKHEPDYYTFFVMGIIWTAFGIIFMEEMPFFFIMGLVFLALGLVNKDKWKATHRTWKDLTAGEKKLKLILIIFLTVLLIAGIVFFAFFAS